jgi:hypothetical protein
MERQGMMIHWVPGMDYSAVKKIVDSFVGG